MKNGLEQWRPKVLFLNSCVHGGGAGNSLDMYLRRAHSEIEAHIVVPEGGDFARKIGHRASLWHIREFVERIHRSPYQALAKVASPGVHLVANWWAISHAAKKIIKLVDRINPDVIYCNHMLAEPIGVFVGMRTKIPVIIHARNIHVTWPGHVVYRYLASRPCVKAIISNSGCTALGYEDSAMEKVRVVYNFIDPSKPASSEVGSTLRMSLNIPPQAPVFGFMGRFVHWKGIDDLIQAFKRVVDAMPDARLVLLGDNDSGSHENLRETYMTLCRQLNIERNVTFLGFQRDVTPYLSLFDALVLPSRQPEPFGRVLIEAMSHRVPCIVSGHGGAVETVIHGQTGLWYAPGNIQDLSQEMIRLAGNGELRNALGRAGQARVRQFYASEVLADKITNIISAVASGKDLRRIPDGLTPEDWKRIRAFADFPPEKIVRFRSNQMDTARMDQLRAEYGAPMAQSSPELLQKTSR